MSETNQKHHSFKKVRPHRVFFWSLLLAGVVLLMMGVIFVLVTGPVQQSQDVRKNASTANGQAQLSFSPKTNTTITGTSDQTIDIQLTTNGKPATLVSLVFDVITHNTIDNNTFTVTPNLSAPFEVKPIQPTKTGSGFRVKLLAIPKSDDSLPIEQSTFSLSQPTTIATLHFKPQARGTLSLNFDLGNSKLFMIQNSKVVDVLQTQEITNYTIANADSTPAPTPNVSTSSLDDLFYYSVNDDTNMLRVYENDTTNRVALGDLKSGTTYKVTYSTRVQNLFKRNDAENKSITVELKANDSSLKGTLSYKDISASSDGSLVSMSGTFVAKDTNTFIATIDSDRVLQEQSEDNNQWKQEVSVGGSSSSSSVKKCNETCGSNRECDVNQRCFNTGSDQRCRLVTNVTDTNCQDLPDQGIHRSCNEYCADSRECASGYTCWYNRCRVPNNLDSLSCRRRQSVVTKGGVTTVVGCNLACSSNRDCQSGLRCYQGSCRLATDATNPSCSIGSSTTEVSPTPEATVSASIEPTATPFVLPTTEPGTMPEPTANESMLDTIGIFLSTYFASLSGMSTIMGVPTPLFLMGVGMLLLIIAIVIFIISRRKKHSENWPPQQPPRTPFTPGMPQQNPQPPATVQAQRETPPLRMVKTADAQSISRPPVQPVAPKQTVYQPAIQKVAPIPAAMVTPAPLAQPRVVPVPSQPTQLTPVTSPAKTFAQRVGQQSLPVQAPVKVATPPVPPVPAPRPNLAPPKPEPLLPQVKAVPQLTQQGSSAQPVKLSTPPPPTRSQPKLATAGTQQFSSMIERLKQKGVTVNPKNNDRG